ncbi:Uncharacterised protein [BD1-7 clade bacterium]|uniref:Protein AaeX n=1 Tax=BD1-7 clade bacterium TaxID=2029982 RepID=A0A5S9QQ21_9GAMM|nr:Uncharacterised protein [BD1-7 clade bacterium]CAA0120095.1 Uncharacterised protein [BD1-7 clade bacterium]CAA0121102.1 Uncharacterised protein [BD1-7 clade bacterium]
MQDWLVMGSLAFPPLFKVVVIGTLIWLVLRFLLRKVPFDEWFWHPGLVDFCLLIIVCSIVNRWIA